VIEFAHGRVRSKEPGQQKLVPPRRGGRDSRDDLAPRIGQVDLLLVLPSEERLLARSLVRDSPDLDRRFGGGREGSEGVGADEVKRKKLGKVAA
jgi:hypothetical protein